MLHEGNLASAYTVIERINAHAEIVRRRVDIEPTRFDDGLLRPFAWFHSVTPDARAMGCGEVPRREPWLASLGKSGAALGISGSV
jgi:hypothetical protein